MRLELCARGPHCPVLTQDAVGGEPFPNAQQPRLVIRIAAQPGLNVESREPDGSSAERGLDRD